MDSVLFALWFFLPAGLANAMPVLANKIPYLRDFTTPLDFGKHYRGKRIFGKNKTWRGLLAGTVIATITVLVQQYLYDQSQFVRDISLNVDYTTFSAFVVGPLFGIGALLGDAVESFAKRQMNIASGDSWFPFDQLDYVLGGMLLTYPVVPLAFEYYLLIVIMWFGLHIVSVYVFYLLGIREKPI